MKIKEEDLHNLCKEMKDNLVCQNCENRWLYEAYWINFYLQRTDKSLYVCPKCWNWIEFTKSSHLTSFVIPIIPE